jgi:hypothetical protein
MKTKPSIITDSPDEIWLDNHDLLKMFPVSARTLQRWRSSNTLPYYKINGKILYKKPEVMEMLNGQKVK